MSYTLIFVPQDTHGHTRSIRMPRLLLWGVVCGIVALPLVAFGLGFFLAAPLEQGRMHQAMSTNETMKNQVADLQKDLGDARTQLDALNTKLNEQTDARAKAEAQVAISETARIAAEDQLKKVSDQLSGLDGQVAMYQGFFKPGKDTMPIQCYNTTASVVAGKRLRYDFNIMHSNQHSDATPVTLQMRMLSGPDILTLDQSQADAADREQKVTLGDPRNIHGSFALDSTPDGIKLFDVRIYTQKGDKLVGHCWKML